MNSLKFFYDYVKGYATCDAVNPVKDGDNSLIAPNSGTSLSKKITAVALLILSAGYTAHQSAPQSISTFTSQIACASLAIHQNNPAWMLLNQHAYAQPEGDEFLVNSELGGEQIKPKVTPFPDGGFLVAWLTGEDDEGDFIGSATKGRFFTDDGDPVSPEFLLTLNPNVTDARKVIPHPSGSFSALYAALNPSTSTFAIFQQKFSLSGQPIQSPILLAESLEDERLSFNLDYTSSGSFTISWISNQTKLAQHFDADGVPQADAFQVISSTLIRTLDDGTYLSFFTGDDDLVGQKYQMNGTAEGSTFVITSGTSRRGNYKVILLPNGNFFSVWEDRPSSSDYDIAGVLFDPNGAVLKSDFTVNTFPSEDQTEPSIASTLTEVVVAWDGDDQDGSQDGIFGQRYNLAGETLGMEFQVNTYFSGEQSDPDVAGLFSGRSVILWHGPGVNGTDIFGQMYGINGVPFSPNNPPSLPQSPVGSPPIPTQPPEGSTPVSTQSLDNSDQTDMQDSQKSDEAEGGSLSPLLPYTLFLAGR